MGCTESSWFLGLQTSPHPEIGTIRARGDGGLKGLIEGNGRIYWGYMRVI